jgi:hypothetical protein
MCQFEDVNYFQIHLFSNYSVIVQPENWLIKCNNLPPNFKKQTKLCHVASTT